ncbi:MAG: efflux RND transporter periplasmic adaptor subunit, partial [Duganella sp.]
VVRLARAGEREAVIQLPETLRPAIGSVAQATLFGADSAGSDHSAAVPVKLRQLSDSADRLTRTFEARYVLSGALAHAPLGATVTIAMAAPRSAAAAAEEGWSVPIGALFDAGKGPGVWVIQGQPSSVSWRPVTVQRLSDDSAHVAARLRQGERIVALGAHLLREGETVRIAGEAAAAAVAKPAAKAGAKP